LVVTPMERSRITIVADETTLIDDNGYPIPKLGPRLS
jgi:hypothetical protein